MKGLTIVLGFAGPKALEWARKVSPNMIPPGAWPIRSLGIPRKPTAGEG